MRRTSKSNYCHYHDVLNAFLCAWLGLLKGHLLLNWLSIEPARRFSSYLRPPRGRGHVGRDCRCVLGITLKWIRVEEKRGLRRAERGAPRFAKQGQVGNAAVCSGGSSVVVSCGAVLGFFGGLYIRRSLIYSPLLVMPMTRLGPTMCKTSDVCGS